MLTLLCISAAAGCSDARDHPTRMGDAGALHGGTLEGRSSHHVVAALFDASTGNRISDARVRAGVGDCDLEPMLDNGVVSYGGLFLMQGPDPYRIHLEIRRARAARPIQAQFVYEHAPDA